MKPMHIGNPEAICRESYWVGADRATFTAKRLERERPLRAAYGSAPMSTIAAKHERSFMDGVKGTTERTC